MNKILVVYATRQGTTEEVAAAIAEPLRRTAGTVDVVPVEQSPDPAGYDALVFGVPLYAGRFLKSGRKYLRQHEGTMAGKPLALFVIGPQDTDKSRADAKKQLDGQLAKHSALEPMSVGLFPGAIRPEKLRFPFNRMKAGDWRDWDEIRGWADELATSLAGQPV